jgi:hypothetical protein
MNTRTMVAAAIYEQAKLFAEAHFGKEITWQRNVSFAKVTESEFLREAAWVIFCSGFRERTLRARFGYLSLCFCDWESAVAITEKATACRTTALAGFNHVGKVEAVIQIARRVASIGFVETKHEILLQPIRTLRTLPYIGPVTVYHLAKNLGLPVAKPDRHLQRLATAVEYSDVHMLCADIAALTGDPIHVVDLILWRFLVENVDRLKNGLA